LEMVIRALRKRPFMPRAAWVLWACLAVVGTALLITYVVALLYRPPNFCFASLFWLITRWKLGIFVIMTLITSTLIISCGIIFIQLQRQSEVTPIERLAAVHMVYYLSSSILTDVGCLRCRQSRDHANNNTGFLDSLLLQRNVQRSANCR
jgi:hypothetical protein